MPVTKADENAEIDLVSTNLTLDFGSPPGPVLQTWERQRDVPIVSNGFMWSNLVDRAWLFGGRPVDDSVALANDIWRFTVDNDTVEWQEVPASVDTGYARPSHGAGCTVPDLQMGFYLGGIQSRTSASDEPNTYFHRLWMFDMRSETLSSIPVPDSVPVVNQSVVFVDTATRSGALVVLGGYVETNGSLELVMDALQITNPID